MNTAERPFLSIITINLNHKEGLKKTIESVLAQTRKDFEYIVIDGGSTDGSVEVIGSYKQQLHYSVSEKDTGIYNAMNKGVKAARGEYLLFLNSADWLHDDNVLQKTLALVDKQAAIYAADVYLEEKESLKRHSNPSSVNYNFFKNAHITHQSSFIKRVLFEKYGLYNEANKIASDWEFFFLVLMIKGEKYQRIPEALSVFNLSGISSFESMQAVNERERKEATNKYISQPLQKELEELEVLRAEMVGYEALKQKFNERRYRLLSQIEKSKLFRWILTVHLMVISKIVNLFSRK